MVFSPLKNHLRWFFTSHFSVREFPRWPLGGAVPPNALHSSADSQSASHCLHFSHCPSCFFALQVYPRRFLTLSFRCLPPRFSPCWTLLLINSPLDRFVLKFLLVQSWFSPPKFFRPYRFVSYPFSFTRFYEHGLFFFVFSLLLLLPPDT